MYSTDIYIKIVGMSQLALVQTENGGGRCKESREDNRKSETGKEIAIFPPVLQMK